jgi:hypothetical protein
MNKIISQIEHDFNIKVIDLENDIISAESYIQANGYDAYQSCSYCIGEKIILGFYNNNELKLISLFHELGHIMRYEDEQFFRLNNYRKFPIELNATNTGIEIAIKYNIIFSDHALSWMYSQAFSYLRDKDDKPLLISKVMQKEFITRKEYGVYR